MPSPFCRSISVASISFATVVFGLACGSSSSPPGSPGGAANAGTTAMNGGSASGTFAGSGAGMAPGPGGSGGNLGAGNGTGATSGSSAAGSTAGAPVGGTGGGGSFGGAGGGGASFAGAGGGATIGGTGPACYTPTTPAAALPVKVPTPVPAPSLGKAGISDLHRGINLGNALEAPEEGAWGVTLTESHFRIPAEAGFDHVRLPVRFSAHSSSSPPYTIDDAFFRRVDWALDQAQSRGLSVVLDVHHFEEMLTNPAASKPWLISLWQQIATRYRSRPASLKFELLNEPNSALDSVWNGIYPDVLAAVRAIDPTRTVILDSVSWASALKLSELGVLTDPALVVTFHMYEPILFTHQGASWLTPEFQTTRVLFPGPPCSMLRPASGAESVAWTAAWFQGYNAGAPATNPGGAKSVEDIFAAVDAFVTRTGRAVYLGEFGVIDQADAGSRERWLRLVRQSAEARNIPWAYWDDGGDFAAYSPSSGAWVPSLRSALLD